MQKIEKENKNWKKGKLKIQISLIGRLAPKVMLDFNMHICIEEEKRLKPVEDYNGVCYTTTRKNLLVIVKPLLDKKLLNWGNHSSPIYFTALLLYCG